jgi:hypothetical protein
LPPLARLPLLILGFLGLFAGIGAGLARLGWPVPDLAAAAAPLHGPLMMCAFFGVVISLERAVAIGRTWAYAGPLFAGLGGVAAMAGAATAASWLFVAGALVPGSPAYDAALHALALGFVFAMVFGHAPIIFPAVLRVAVPYHPVFYLPLALLHLSLLVRLAGDASARLDWTRIGGTLNALALAAFIVNTAGAVARGRRRGVEPR